MKQRTGETSYRYGRHADAQSDDPHAETQGDDADVLDAVVGEQPFQVVLRKRKQDAQDAGAQADHA